MKRDFLTLLDQTPQWLEGILGRATQMKAEGPGPGRCPLLGKSVGLLFEKPSTRTRVSFEVGIYQLGGQPIFLSPQDVQLSRGETLRDTAQVLSRYLSALVVRTFSHETLEELASEASIPVVNALTDRAHPCQALGDLLTIRETFGEAAGLKVAYLGDGNNVANSLMLACAMSGLTFVIACPEGYDPDPLYLEASRAAARGTGGEVRVVRDPFEAAREAHILYTDVWASMGQEKEAARRRRDLAPYQVNGDVLRSAGTDARIMHCLPAKRGEEITDEVMDHPRSVIMDQAENRLHAQKALLEWLMG